MGSAIRIEVKIAINQIRKNYRNNSDIKKYIKYKKSGIIFECNHEVRRLYDDLYYFELVRKNFKLSSGVNCEQTNSTFN